MGLLDEAIRQHLELKRQHGASDEELQLQEQEALGPVRREPEEPVDPVPEEADPLAETLPGEDGESIYEDPGAPVEAGAGAPAYEEALPDPAAEAPFDPSPHEAFEEPLDPYVEPAVPAVDAPTEAYEPEYDFDAPPADDAAVRGFGDVHEPLEEGAAPYEDEEGEEGEDVLEETPEFLQETPEHDRLWFEQKPPRDFDFDE